ncbi:MAG: hypothetical protein R3350_10230 [Saprospiraceae bacterium]|nr:hypothetical protein [Saprospiraceae bacterium]
MKEFAFGLLAVIAGYGAVVLGTSLIFYLMPHGGRYNESAGWELGLAALLVPACAVFGGYLARKVSGRKSFLFPAVISLFIIVETAWLISRGTGAPVWFDLVAGGSIVAGLFAGMYGDDLWQTFGFKRKRKLI